MCISNSIVVAPDTSQLFHLEHPVYFTTVAMYNGVNRSLVRGKLTSLNNVADDERDYVSRSGVTRRFCIPLNRTVVAVIHRKSTFRMIKRVYTDESWKSCSRRGGYDDATCKGADNYRGT